MKRVVPKKLFKGLVHALCQDTKIHLRRKKRIQVKLKPIALAIHVLFLARTLKK
ncbi:hypothetical protein J6590_106486, partial [Homalodisca vitripennis]